MKKMISLLIMMSLIVACVTDVSAAIGRQNGPGPAPNSGDCDPDQSGW